MSGDDGARQVSRVIGTRYPSIWTKDAHGGPYRKATSSADGYDALTQRPDGSKIKREPGYEKPQSGPTTNFVGNHMTQAAIDLVQGELRPRGKMNAAASALLRLPAVVSMQPAEGLVVIRSEPAQSDYLRLLRRAVRGDQPDQALRGSAE